MDITETFYAASRQEWREWLAENYSDTSEIWLVSYRKHTGQPGVAYGDAVKEALCFGWIDSTRKKVDDERYAQRFTPRRDGSEFSQTNRERFARLLARGKVIPSVRKAHADHRPEAFEIPADILEALQANKQAWTFFQTTSPPYQRIRAAYVDSARQWPDEFQKRLDHLVEKSAQSKQYGYGIEEFY